MTTSEKTPREEDLRRRMRRFYRDATGYQEQTAQHAAGYFDRYRRTLERYLPDGPLHVLELGAGTGEALAPLAVGRFSRIVGLELAPAHLEAFRDRGEDWWAVGGDALSLPFQGKSFDVVTSFQVVEHLPRVDWMIDEAVRVLRRPGWLVVGMPNHASLWTPLEDALTGRTRKAFGVYGRAGALRWWLRNLRIMAGKRTRPGADFRYQEPHIGAGSSGGDRDAVYYACPLDLLRAMRSRGAELVGTDAELRWGSLGRFVPTESRGSVVGVWRV